jgi:hypothetical protein
MHVAVVMAYHVDVFLGPMINELSEEHNEQHL